MTGEPIDLIQLWQCAERAKNHFAMLKSNPAPVFADIGLWLCGNDDSLRYYCTPMNSRLFASTGVDGCHWCILELPGRKEHENPIVFVSPSDSDCLYIGGENLRDFLEIGLNCRTFDGVGYEDRMNKCTEKEPLWQFIKEDLKLNERTGINAWINELQTRYMSMIELDPNA